MKPSDLDDVEDKPVRWKITVVVQGDSRIYFSGKEKLEKHANQAEWFQNIPDALDRIRDITESKLVTQISLTSSAYKVWR